MKIYIITWTKAYGATGEDPETAIEGAYKTREAAMKHLNEIKEEDLDLEEYDDREDIIYSIDEDEDSVQFYELHETELS